MDKLEKLVEENIDKGIVVGADTDWSWTATTIKSKEHFQRMKEGEEHLLRASCWDRFSVEIGGDRQDCTVEIPNQFAKLAFENGFLRGVWQVEQWLERIYTCGIKYMKYEMIKDMQKEVSPIFKKYIEMVETLKKYPHPDPPPK